MNLDFPEFKIGDLVEVAGYEKNGAIFGYFPGEFKENPKLWLIFKVTKVTPYKIEVQCCDDRYPNSQCLWAYFSDDVGLIRKKGSIIKTINSGMRCLDCQEYYEYVSEPNHKDGLVCYPCRTSNNWKWEAGLLK